MRGTSLGLHPGSLRRGSLVVALGAAGVAVEAGSKAAATLAAPAPAAVRIDTSKRYQTMLGFGAALTFRFDDPHMLYGSERGSPKDTVPAVALEYQGIGSNPVQIPVAATVPALFTLDSSGKGQVAALHSDYSVNGPSNPADRGSIVSLYATGEGQTDAAGVGGKLAGDPLPKPRLHVSVRIGGLPAVVHYAGAAPGLVAGVLQVNVRIPDQVAPGDAVAVELSVGEARSQPGVTLAVR